jgi:hypothetical protein
MGSKQAKMIRNAGIEDMAVNNEIDLYAEKKKDDSELICVIYYYMELRF